MPHAILDWLRGLLVQYGYWAVAGALLLENAGVPVPGESILLLASFVAFSEHTLQLSWIIVVGTTAATLGDNLGFVLGYYGGRPLLEHYQRFFRIRTATLTRGEQVFARYGPVTVLFARFVFGMRIITGPLAGVLRMPWFGRHWQRLVQELKVFDIVVALVALLAIVFLWWRGRRGACIR